MQAGDAELEGQRLAPLAGLLVHLLAGPFDDLLDARGVDPSVLDQLAQGPRGDRAAQRIPGRKHDRARRVVHQQVDAGRVLEGADVPPLAADDPPLHFVAGEGEEGDRPFAGHRAAQRGHRGDHGLARDVLGRAAGGVRRLLGQPGDLPLQAGLDRGEQLGPRLVGGQLGGRLELAAQLVLGRADPPLPLVDRRAPRVERAGPFREVLGAAVERDGPLFERLALFGDLRLALRLLAGGLVEFRLARLVLALELPAVAVEAAGELLADAPFLVRLERGDPFDLLPQEA